MFKFLCRLLRVGFRGKELHDRYQNTGRQDPVPALTISKDQMKDANFPTLEQEYPHSTEPSFEEHNAHRRRPLLRKPS